ncbi:MAG: AmmeMemoRadiSam system protein B [Acidimicrobiales bacterium]|nr:AmmeMemoRadiSam system protein B [Acidimicrobiales bacterium]
MADPSLTVRPEAVAGRFYPADPDALAAQVDGLLAAAAEAAPPAAATGPASLPAVAPKALIVPHAAYLYSGPVAARAYALLAADRAAARAVERVVLIGPAHHVPVRGVAVSGVDALATPLGEVPVDAHGRDALLTHPAVMIDDLSHGPEHCLEVQLPFLQRILGDFTVLPLLAGRAPADVVADILGLVWDGPSTLVVVSTDLSHFHDHATARALDARTAAAIATGEWGSIGPDDACGATPLRGLLEAARRRGMAVEQLDVRTSHDTAGPPDRVVGYGAFALR